MGKKKGVGSRATRGRGSQQTRKVTCAKVTSRFADKPVQRNAANARERSRMRTLSKAFCKLKTTLPWVPPDTKLSKLDTLRLASCYISYLKEVLTEDEVSKSGLSKTPKHPMTMAWPILALASNSQKLSKEPLVSLTKPSEKFSNDNRVNEPVNPTSQNPPQFSMNSDWSSLSFFLSN